MCSHFPVKASLRRDMLIRRNRIVASQSRTAASALVRAACQVLRFAGHVRCCGRGSIVAGYWPIAGEVDVRPLLKRLATLGCRLALPAIAAPKKHLVFRSWRPGLVLDAGPHGTHHPPTWINLVVPDVILVPLLAFDQACFRLGFGGGYYDRTLTRLRCLQKRRIITIGVAFADQRVFKIPHQLYDVALDLIWCEQGMILPRHLVPTKLLRKINPKTGSRRREK